MKKVKITEQQYRIISEEYVQQNLFPDDKITSDQEKKRETDKLNKEKRNAKAREKYKEKKEQDKKKFEKSHIIARGTGEDLFGNKYSDDEKKSAEEYIRKHFKKKN